MPDDSADKVSDFWGDERAGLRRHNWLEHPVARAVINKRVSGDPDLATAEHWRRRFLPSPPPLALSLGCGFGSFERAAISMGLAANMDANDISEAAIEQARRYAAEAGLSDRITYAVVDLDRDTLPEAHYDAIFGISSVHHVAALETLFAQCRRALKPGGLLFMDEYVGPARFQSEAKVVALINALMQSLPERYRRSVYMNNEARQSFTNPPIAWFEEHDPSEAIRSDAIIPTLQNDFDIVELRPYGGAILHMLLSGTAGNFDPSSESDTALLETLASLEEQLEAAGAIASDFAAIVARPKPF